MMMLVPEAWAGNKSMDADRKAFYEYHAALMEPWDGPAALVFTDGRQIGATLDRNGLRPARYIVTDDDRVIMASEAGVLPVPAEEDRHQVAAAARPHAARSTSSRAASSPTRRSSHEIATRHPYKQWLANTQLILEDLKPVEPRALRKDVSLLDRQQAFGYTQEDTKLLMSPMATTGQEAVGSMGTDTPISAMSDKSKMLYTYFKQNFAQVTNPPIDPIREELVMSLVSFIGPRPNIFDLDRYLAQEAARSAPADPHQRRPREDPLHRPHRGPLRHQDARRHLCRPTEGAAGMPARRRAAVRARGGGGRLAATTSSSCPTARSVRTASPSRRCWPPRPCTIT